MLITFHIFIGRPQNETTFILHSKSIMMNAGESQWKPTRVLSVHIKLTLSLRCYQQILKLKVHTHAPVDLHTLLGGKEGKRHTQMFMSFIVGVGVIHS